MGINRLEGQQRLRLQEQNQWHGRKVTFGRPQRGSGQLRNGLIQAVLSRSGDPLTSNEHIVGRCREHIEELLNPRDMHPGHKSEPEMSGLSVSISLIEVNGNRVGMRSEMLKALDVVGLSWLTHLCNISWTSGAEPLDWQTGGTYF